MAIRRRVIRYAAAWLIMVAVAMAPSALPIDMTGAPTLVEGEPRGFRAATVDRFVRRELRLSRVPGAAVAVVQDGETVYLRGFSRAGEREVTPRSRFRLGSATKSFTALAVMQLAESGRLSLDAPVRRYVPWFRLASAQASRSVTVRHLLTHTSGISRKVGLRGLDGDGRGSVRSLVEGLRTVTPASSPGTTYAYSNANYAILGLVVEAASGQRYDRYLDTHVLDPLGMAESSAADVDGLVPGYHPWVGVPIPTASPYLGSAVPAGFVSTTAADLGHYLAAQLGDRPGAQEVVSAQGLAELHRPAVDTHHLVEGAPQWYAKGWTVGRFGGADAVWHHGNAFIHSSTLVLLPHRDAAVAVMTNAPSTLSLPSDRVARGVVRIMGGVAPATAGREANLVVLIVGSVLFAYVAFVVRGVSSVRRPSRRPPAVGALWAAARYLVVPAAVLHALHSTFGRVGFAWRELPDVTAVLGGGSVVLLVCGAVRAVGFARRRLTGAPVVTPP